MIQTPTNLSKNLDKSKTQEQETLVSIDILLEMEKQVQESYENQPKSSNVQSYFNSVKIFLGNVFLTMPNVFSQTGWLGGVILYSFIAVLNTYTMNQMIWVGRVYSKKKNVHGLTTNVTSYTDLSYRIHGDNGKIFVIIFMFIAQLSCCIGYLYFVALNIDTIICDQTNGGFCDKKVLYKFLMLIPTIPISLIKTYTYLSYVSMVGILCAVTGGIMMIGYMGKELEDGTYVQEDMKLFDVSQFFGHIGIAMFIFEGNGVVLNLNHVAKNQKKYPSILTSAVVSVIIWYLIISCIGYSTFRGEVKEYVTSNLPISGFTILIYVLFSFNAIASYPVQILCAFEIVEDLKFFRQERDSKLVKNIKIYTERIAIIVVVTIVAVLVPKFVDFLNISGSVSSSVLGFILPPLYYFRCYGLVNLKWWDIAFNVFLILFGIFGGIYSLYTSIDNLING
ncbi:UNKNOWN [Stylonychia lemnae]|uniref:Amino acid transporter transmembrane domain-containing protein n=1 Tax=Stylonychia lemnae TaxID=5949 RepID=A0A078ARB3_STYLE|nr:UNKNOWN [Stylonychia lemnae]|eukprot:CDW84980.1 UNKNOWN [Stylonychia lemnae]